MHEAVGGVAGNAAAKIDVWNLLQTSMFSLWKTVLTVLQMNGGFSYFCRSGIAL
jgi:hypothetical protein